MHPVVGRVNGTPIVTLATATASGIHASVGGGLNVISTERFGDSFGHTGLFCRIHRGDGSVSHRVVVFVHRRPNGDNVVCYLSEGGIRRLTRMLGTGSVGTTPCRTNLSSTAHSRARSSFLVRHVSIVITAVTFNVNVSGPSMEFIVRCSVPGDLRNCCRRANHTKHSKKRNVYVTFCTHGSLEGLRGFVRGGPITRRSVNQRLLRRATTCTRSSIYHHGVLLRCFKRRCSIRGYRGYSGYLRPSIGFRTGSTLIIILRTITTIGRGFHRRCVVSFIGKHTASSVISRGRSGLRRFNTNRSVSTGM